MTHDILKPEYPLKWLLRELESRMDENAYKKIMAEFDVVKRRYDLAVNIRASKLRLENLEKSRGYWSDSEDMRSNIPRRIERKKAHIAKLMKELEELDI